MDRTRFFDKTSVNNVSELDFMKNTLSNLKLVYQPSIYRVDQTDLLRPDMISYKNYGTVQYWWIIMLHNKIQDPFNELVVGMLLEIPNQLDIYDFFKQYRKR